MPPPSSKVRSFFTRICFGPMPRKRDRRSPSVGGRPTGGKISAKPHPASVDLRDASLLPSKWSEKHICMTAQYNCKHGCSATARMLLGSCSSAARPLQYYCISHAALLQRPCSRTAKAVQQTCRGEAEKPPRQGSPPVAQSVPSGQVRSAQGGREESGRLPLGYCSWARDLCAIFTPNRSLESKAISFCRRAD